MSTSSLRQHQRKSVIVTGGHSPLARNHSAGNPAHNHSSSTSFATQRSSKSLPSPTMTTTKTTTTGRTNTFHTNNNNQLNEKTSNNIFNFEHPINHFHNSSINQNINETNMLRSTRHLCGSIIPLQSSSPSPNIDHQSLDNEHSSSPIFFPLPLRKLDLKYRSYF